MSVPVDTTTWVVGFVVAGVVVLVVVAVVVSIIATAARIRDQVRHVHDQLEAARSNTAALWRVEATTVASADILDMARHAREALER